MQQGDSYAATSTQVTVSIVSHGHGALVTSLLADLAIRCNGGIEVVLTLNVPEQLSADENTYPFRLKLIRNETPRGFGANHNTAYAHGASPHFCVLNPDVRLGEDPFPQLVAELRDPSVGVAAPLILNPAGDVEDSARRFPTPWFIARKLLGRTGEPDYRIGHTTFSPDWVAGMFMLFRKDVYAEMAGFDERYFLYYEDVDLCRRLRKRGYDVRVLPCVTAVHDARRESRRSGRHLRWHLASMLRFMATR